MRNWGFVVIIPP